MNTDKNSDRLMDCSKCNTVNGCDECGVFLDPHPTFDAAPKDIEIPTSHIVGDDIILEEK